MSLLVFGFCMFLFGCQSLIEYPSLSDITKNEEFTKAYIASVNGDAQVIDVDYMALKEKDFFALPQTPSHFFKKKSVNNIKPLTNGESQVKHKAPLPQAGGYPTSFCNADAWAMPLI